MSFIDSQKRVLSGMRPTGRLHLGHYHGVLKNWLTLQHEYDCMFFVADWHALTTHYDEPEVIQENVWQMVVDWLAAGVNPGSSSLFIQSRVPEHAELHLLLSMITPLSWVERVPSYKDMLTKNKERELATYGFLGYPVLQSADILIYQAGNVPVGADQVPHVEMTREIARRFNHIYGRDLGFEDIAEGAIRKLGRKNAKLYRGLRRDYMERGNQEALETATALVSDQQNIPLSDRDRLFGYLEGGGKVILPEPQALLTDASVMPGLDGYKMSKSYDNTISLREEPDSVDKKIKTMTTDPARVRRNDPGDPSKCPVFALHKIYSESDQQEWVIQGCRSGTIGCIDCKKPLIEAVLEEQQPMRERAKQYESNPDLVKSIVSEGCEKARVIAKSTLEEVRSAMGLEYR
ncbi:MAG: tryptophan--tRNA ligase [Candidatus Azotimanducaceae bacterium]|uniref:Tryptophan--tRNA ligase n=1 Tax=OM182 bacterium TaxID=2510334 RepID=A0A520S186_9GAMM|nr:tryptophan--tRNA ligase [Gammaproteobacteria bacterium]OUV68791.1 MAG: tryptophan--tRNA ligase [Gammaproteobacteria bacterium TMED133]RZO76227.1 MAG: tryptophan--tRNA ligase [OM182 bacterium]